MGKLSEKYIQKKSLVFLENYYTSKYDLNILYSKEEARTKVKKKKYYRADGILCFNSTIQDLHLVSMEAKSHKTVNSLLPFWNRKLFNFYDILIVIVVSVISLYMFRNLNWYWNLMISFILAMKASIIFSDNIAKFEPDSFKKSEVVDQLLNYPANEQWVAISTDSRNLTRHKTSTFSNDSNENNLISICKNKGIGLLLVTNKKVEIYLEPKFKKGNYLNNYAMENKIIKRLDLVKT